MKISFPKIMNSIEELENVNRTNPYYVSASLVHVLTVYQPQNETLFYEMLQLLMGPYQEISPLLKQQIKDRMLQHDKYGYIGNSYFVGATPENDYQPKIPYEVEVQENDYSKSEEGYLRLLLKSGGADHLRPVTLRLAKDGNYYLWSDSILGLLSDIKPVESSNPWA